jgi:4-hydroxybenzoate polyprenyltransferase/phosphoserine phosphatase
MKAWNAVKDSALPAASVQPVPLCVDLDGTLIRTDVLWEMVVQLWRRPLLALQALAALFTRGKAALKSVLVAQLPIDPAALPYREDVLAYAAAEHASGREVALATATHREVAERIAQHLGIFTRVFATEPGINLSGARKRDVLEAAYGRGSFDYIGDSVKDIPILGAAHGILLVDPPALLLRKAEAGGNLVRVFSGPRLSVKVVAKAMRLHQWAKNALLALPVLAAHIMFNLQAWVSVGVAFLAFGLVASSTYLLNDLVDLPSDRKHAKKRSRPLASGVMPIPTGIVLAAGSGVLGVVLSAAFLPTKFMGYLVVYIVLTLAYSFSLKRRLMLDVLALAVLYTLRILAGGAATATFVSEWLLMFSLFIFLSLAFLKRAIELQGESGDKRIAGRGYMPVDLETIRIMGASSGLMSVLVLAMYISSPAVTQFYRAPQVLWFICPLLIYWISRMWFLAARDEVHHDPVVFALVDKRSYVLLACALVILVVATVGTSGMRL